MKDRSFLYELRAHLIYVKVGEIAFPVYLPVKHNNDSKLPPLHSEQRKLMGVLAVLHAVGLISTLMCLSIGTPKNNIFSILFQMKNSLFLDVPKFR